MLDDATMPLKGIEVVELGQSVAAPYASWILGALGAQILKIERPDGGDDARQWGRMFADGRSSFFEALNANKRSVRVDLKDEAARDWVKRYCVDKADVVIQNLRPGRVADFGLDATNLLAIKPTLVYCNLGAFGATGPRKGHAGYDPLMQAFSGIMSVTGEADRPPVRVGVSIVDMGSGMWSALGIVAALLERQKSGHGCIVDTSLYETAIGWVTNQVAMVRVDGRNPEKTGSGARGMAPYQAYRCQDGYLVVTAPNDRLFHKLATALGKSEWIADPRFATNQRRYANLVDLNGLLEPLLATETREHWQHLLDAVGVPNAPVRSITEMLADPQMIALEIAQSLPGASPPLIGLPVSFNGRRPRLRSMPPALGEHDAMLKDD